MNSDFYRAFEERYYAPRGVIKELRKQYLPFTDIISSLYPGGETYDLGCGRGEWLELMLESGMKPFGVDLDDGMLQSCHEHNLPAKQGDAVSHLSSIADNSQAIVTAFHVIEHLDFEQLRTVVVEALRVLKPGGLLIMETPNPENIFVATSNFYLDPTHKRPIPSQLLSFLTEYHGFVRSTSLRLQESKALLDNDSISLQNVLEGASPDYAVIAQKAASPEINELFDKLFQLESGLSLKTLATSFDRRLQRFEVKALHIAERASEMETTVRQNTERADQAVSIARHADEHATQAVSTARQANERADQAESTARHAVERTSQAESAAHHAAERAAQSVSAAQNAAERAGQTESTARQAAERATQAESAAQHAVERAAQAESAAHHSAQALHAIYASYSWRITAPLRWIGSRMRSFCIRIPSFHVFQAVKTRIISPLLAMSIGFVLNRPRLKEYLQDRIRRHPSIEARLFRFAAHKGIVGHPASPPTPVAPRMPSTAPSDVSQETLRVYNDLSEAIRRHHQRKP